MHNNSAPDNRASSSRRINHAARRDDIFNKSVPTKRTVCPTWCTVPVSPAPAGTGPTEFLLWEITSLPGRYYPNEVVARAAALALRPCGDPALRAIRAVPCKFV